MIRHTVVFRLGHRSGSARESEFLGAARELASIPGVERFEILRQVGKKSAFTFGLSMEFADEATYARYNESPLHERLVRERWTQEVEEFVELDYIPYREGAKSHEL